MTRDYVYWMVLGLLLVGYGVWQALRLQPLDWSPTLELDGNNPYDLRAFDAIWTDLGPNRPLSSESRSLVELLTDSTALSTRTVAIVDAIIDFQLTEPQSPLDSTLRRAVVDFTSQGGTLLLAGAEIDRSVLRALGLARQQFGMDGFSPFVSPLRDTSHYHIEVAATQEGPLVPSAFVGMGMGQIPVSADSPPDSLLLPGVRMPETLVRVCDEDCASRHNDKMLLVRVPMGEGSVVVTSGVLALTNVALLDYDTLPLADALITALPDGPVVRKVNTFASGRPASPLHVLTRFPALQWAWYTLLALGLLALIAYARRRQRPQEPIVARRNETAAFVQTVAALYRRRGDHVNLTRKMASRFRHTAFDVYGLPHRHQTADHTAARVGMPLGDAEALIRWVDRAESGKLTTGSEVEEFAERLAPFFDRAPRTSRLPLSS